MELKKLTDDQLESLLCKALADRAGDQVSALKELQKFRKAVPTGEKGEYVTTVMGEMITDALAVQLDDLEKRIGESLKAGEYFSIKLNTEKALRIEELRMSICTNHLMDIYDAGSEHDRTEAV